LLEQSHGRYSLNSECTGVKKIVSKKKDERNHPNLFPRILDQFLSLELEYEFEMNEDQQLTKNRRKYDIDAYNS
jgi:hypothetical protein